MNRNFLLFIFLGVFVVSIGFFIQVYGKNVDLYIPLSILATGSLIAIAINTINLPK